jgi:hypothetical protein
MADVYYIVDRNLASYGEISGCHCDECEEVCLL